jgi:hypothetical protein
MRTTLDIDDDILLAVKELARTERKPAGKVISDLARAALTNAKDIVGPKGPGGTVLEKGWHVFPSRGGVITTEAVARLLEEADLEDAGLIKSE